MLAEKHALTVEELEAQAALELPDREMLGLINIRIVNVLNNLRLTVTVSNNNVAVQVCNVVVALNAIAKNAYFFRCKILQT
jgi:hypothetical protein